MNHPNDHFDILPKPSGRRVPTTEELTEFVLDQGERTRAEILMGSSAVLFDARSQHQHGESPFRIAKSSDLSPAERLERLDFSAIGEQILDRNQDLQAQLSDEFAICMQMDPRRIAAMMNQVRSEHGKAPVVEPEIERLANPEVAKRSYEGVIIDQFSTQSILRTDDGKDVLLEHDQLDAKPTRNARAKVVFEGGRGSVSLAQSKIEGPGKTPPAKEPGRGR